MTHVFRGHFDGEVLVPEQPLDLPVGRVMEFHIQEIASARSGNETAEALLAAVRSGPEVTAADTAALERAIAELPLKQGVVGGVFDEPA